MSAQQPSEPIPIPVDENMMWSCPCCSPEYEIARQNSVRVMLEQLEEARRLQEAKYFQYSR